MVTFKLNQKIRFRNYYSPGSKYKRFEGQTGRISFVNNNYSYDIELDHPGTGDRFVNYVSGKMIETYESGLNTEQKHKLIVDRFNKTISEAKKVIWEKQTLIENNSLKLEYLEQNPEITEFSEANFLAWKTSQAVMAYLLNTGIIHTFNSAFNNYGIRDNITGIVISTLEEFKKINKK